MSGDLSMRRGVAAKWEADPASYVLPSEVEKHNVPAIEQVNYGTVMSHGWSTFGNVRPLVIAANEKKNSLLVLDGQESSPKIPQRLRPSFDPSPKIRTIPPLPKRRIVLGNWNVWGAAFLLSFL